MGKSCNRNVKCLQKFSVREKFRVPEELYDLIIMLIGYDANEANVEKRVGSGQYAYEILVHLAKIIGADQLSIFLKNQPRLDFQQPTENITYRIFGPKPLWTQFALPVHLFLDRPRLDVFFSPAHYAPRFSPCPTVITIHDLSYLKFPQYFLKKDLQQLKNWTAYSVKKAQHIITPSQSAKNDVVSFYNYPANKVTAIPHGFNKERFTANIDQNKITQVKQTYGISKDYILYLGTLQPRKNIIWLLDAFAPVSKAKPDITLVIAGKKGWLFEEIFKHVKELNIEHRVLFTDYVPDDVVQYLYAGALLYILPSLYEGFGMPLVEAMACGTLVAGSNVSSIPEVIGPGWLFDPENVNEMTKTILDVLTLSKDERQKRQKASIAFANTFSWEKAADATLGVLKNVARQN